MDEKAEKIMTNYVKHTEKYVNDHKGDFSSFKTIYHRFIKKDNIDPTMEYTKEIIKRMEKDKISSQISMQISEAIMPEIQGMKKEIMIMAIPLILGFSTFFTCAIMLGFFTRPIEISNTPVIYLTIGMAIGGILFGFGQGLRGKFKINSTTKSMLFQATTAYGAAKMQGQGSFGAFRILDEMKAKQGKDMQIRVNQPKVVYKR